MAESVKLQNNRYWDLSSIKGSSETTITFTADTTYVSNAYNIRVRKSLNNVLMQVSASLKALTVSTSAYTIGTIPSEYAPAYSVNFILTKSNSPVILLGQITANGNVQVFNLNQDTAAGWYDGSVMWFNA